MGYAYIDGLVQDCSILSHRYIGLSYSETTWAVSIAQSTHHEVQGGGKNFCPHGGPSGELIAQYRPPMSFCLTILENRKKIYESRR